MERNHDYIDEMHDFSHEADPAKPGPGASNFSILDSLLRSKLVITKASHRNHQPGLAAPDEIITTNRYILITRGRLFYETEGVPVELRKGTLVFVPAGTRRRWWVSKGKYCELLWCEFSSSLHEVSPQQPFQGNSPNLKLEEASLRRILKLYQKIGPTFPEQQEENHSLLYLQMEGELKASLARFWTAAKPWRKKQNLFQPRHPSIIKAVASIESDYPKYLALENLYKETVLSPNHLRLLFKKQVGSSPSQYLKSIRMRHARALLHRTQTSIKEVAEAVGFADALYFSRQYHLFWGRSPSRDRQTLDPGPA